jgi:hypothetical protein
MKKTPKSKISILDYIFIFFYAEKFSRSTHSITTT